MWKVTYNNKVKNILASNDIELGSFEYLYENVCFYNSLLLKIIIVPLIGGHRTLLFFFLK